MKIYKGLVTADDPAELVEILDSALGTLERTAAPPPEAAGNSEIQQPPLQQAKPKPSTSSEKLARPVKRPVGRPRKDGRPPIPRKKRRGRRKRKRLDDDDEDFPGRSIKISKDECIPTVADVDDPEKFPFKCDVCDKIFATQTWRDFHYEQHESPLLTYLVCSLCDEAFKFLTGEYNSLVGWKEEPKKRLFSS